MGKKEVVVVHKVRTPKMGEVAGEVLQVLGYTRMRVKCSDGKERLCRIPGRVRWRMRVHDGDFVLVEPWEIEKDTKGDVIWRYVPNDVEWLKAKGYVK